MGFEDTGDLEEAIKIQLSNLAGLITDDGYELVCGQAEQELGWSFPVTNPTKAYWLVQRGTRHALNILRIASAYKFKYKQVNLQHRFDHFSKLIETFDEEFYEAMSSDLGLFAGVSAYEMFGTKVDAGFAYDVIGKDITYNVDKYVQFTPSGN